MGLSIAYATDNGYAQHVAVSIHSLLTNTTDIRKLHIYILSNKLTKSNIEKLRLTASKFDKSLTFIDISNITKLLPPEIDVANLSISTYCRLFLPELMPPTIDRVLYLDCDTYVSEDICDIDEYITEKDWYVAGVEDTMYPHMKTGIGLYPDELYINAGVLYINLARWRNEKLTIRFIDFIKKFNGAVPHLDQGVINGVFRSGKLRLPLRYNVQAPIYAINKYKDLLDFFSLDSFYSEAEVSEAKNKPMIVHYTSFFVERPWFSFCLHPLKSLYRGALAESAYARNGLSENGISILHKLKDICFKYFQPLYLILRRK